MMKRKTIVCIFAHPDDESFGPSGTITHLAKENDVYVLCATKGEVGGDGNARAKELEQSAKILGVRKVFFLGFKDGTLCNNLYHTIAEKIETHLTKLKPDTLLTYEHRGISGHIDHIAMSMITTFVFNKLSFIKEIMYYCLSEELRIFAPKDYFIYFPPGYSKQVIHEVFDVSSYLETKIRAIKSHASQEKDIKRILSTIHSRPPEECFMVIKK